MAEIEIEPMLPALAKVIADSFPELQGRSLAVSEVDPFRDKTNVPTLPLAVCALVGEQAQQSPYGGGLIELADDILIQFIFEPVKYTLKGGSDSPFFAYYDYETLRDRLLNVLQVWRTPRNGGLAFKTLDVESDEFAVYIAFRFTVSEKWCNTVNQEAVEFTLQTKMVGPVSECCDPCSDSKC